MPERKIFATLLDIISDSLDPMIQKDVPNTGLRWVQYTHDKRECVIYDRSTDKDSFNVTDNRVYLKSHAEFIIVYGKDGRMIDVVGFCE